MNSEDHDTPGSEAPKVRRSIFLPEELEARLARLANERQTSPNDLICEILDAALASQDDAPEERNVEG
jgi:hypothetical protein